MSKLVELRKKLKSKKGFTLMEMLIVVAIIVILLAIAIPAFNGSLRKARLAADEANVRSYYAEVMVQAMADDSYTIPTDDTLPTKYNDGKFQVKGAKMKVAGDTADTFKITYKAGTDTYTIGGDGQDLTID